MKAYSRTPLTPPGRAVASQDVSATTSRSRTSTVVGILVGLVLLGLVAAFAIGLPKAAGDDATEAAADVELSAPDTLPGGYAAADDAASFADGDLAQQAEAIAQQQAASTKYGNQVLPDVLGTPAVTRSYVVDGTTAVFVQVFQSDGGAFALARSPTPRPRTARAARRWRRSETVPASSPTDRAPTGAPARPPRASARSARTG